MYFTFSHCLLCNLLTTILRPNFGTPVDTPQQLVEKTMTVYMLPYSVGWGKTMAEDPDPYMRKLSETLIIPHTWEEFDNLNKYMTLKAGTHAAIDSSLTTEQKNWGKEYNHGRGWYRSKEKFPGDYPYSGYLTHKNWVLNEEVHYTFYEVSIISTLTMCR